MSSRPFTIERFQGNVILDRDGDRLTISCAVPGHGEMRLNSCRDVFYCFKCYNEITKHEVWENA